jgi:hypothetical protein
MSTDTQAERSSLETAPEPAKVVIQTSLTDIVSAIGVGVMVVISTVIIVTAMIEGTFLQ